MESEKTKNFILIGDHKHFIRCRFCNSEKMQVVIDLGNVPLAGGFFKKGNSQKLAKEKLYPLQICFCPNCFLLQINNVVNADILFENYFYFSSSIKTLVDHFETNVQELTKILPNTKKRLIVEIGCNDGSFIKSLVHNGYKALGVDPAQNITQPLIKQGLPIINDYFSEKLAKKIVNQYGHADAIYSFHTLAHIEDMNDVIKGVKVLLKRSGFLAFEVHYLGDLIREVQYDMMYHEHQYYYSLIALKNFFAMQDMEIFDVKPNPIRGGSMMYFVQNKQFGKRKISKNLINLVLKEKKQGLDKAKTFTAFFNYINNTKRKLLKLINEVKAKKQTIVGYGASGRGTILMNYCNLTKQLLDYVIDDAPAKHGAYTPGTHHEIYSSAALNSSNRPDYVVLFAWPFIEEIKKRHSKYLEKGGKFIVPLPRVKIIGN